jgi:hypothetical protein
MKKYASAMMVEKSTKNCLTADQIARRSGSASYGARLPSPRVFLHLQLENISIGLMLSLFQSDFVNTAKKLVMKKRKQIRCASLLLS